MQILQPYRNQQGFTLIEAIVAMFILTIGILAAAAMQGSAIRASTVSYDRTEANNIATALVETLQTIKFDDDLLKADDPGVNRLVDHIPDLSAPGKTCRFTNLTASMQREWYKKCEEEKCYAYKGKGSLGKGKLPDMLHELITVVNGDAGLIEDKSGFTYVMYWWVQDVSIEEQPGQFRVTHKNIHVFLEWHTPYGKNHLAYTTTKYLNVFRKQ